MQIPGIMDFERLENLRREDPALRLLRAENLPFIASFLHAAFLKNNQRSAGFATLESQLSDHLAHLRRTLGEDSFPKSAKQYLEDWSHPETAYLRKYYETGTDEPFYDLTSPIERVLEWLRSSLEDKTFVGTESRMLTLFQLLREFILLAERDPETRVRELELERREIDAEIERVRLGLFSPLTETQAKERFYQIEDTARKLLADFRQIEDNFRSLDRATRERITLSEEAKGVVLDGVFGEHDMIWDSEQGRSFRAFWEFLMSSQRQDEMDSMLTTIYQKPEIKKTEPDPFLRSIRFLLLEAADKVHRTNGLLIEQLRKLLEDRNLLENRRITELIRAIEKNAVEMKDLLEPDREFTFMMETRANFDLVMSRGLYVPPAHPVIAGGLLSEGIGSENTEALFNQIVVDEQELRRNIDSLLELHPQVRLESVLERFPPKYGLAELVVYFKIAANDRNAIIDETGEVSIIVTNSAGLRKSIRFPRVLFRRPSFQGGAIEAIN